MQKGFLKNRAIHGLYILLRYDEGYLWGRSPHPILRRSRIGNPKVCFTKGFLMRFALLRTK